MKLTKTQLKEIVTREIGKQLDEGMADLEQDAFQLKSLLYRLEKDFGKIYELAQQLNNIMYDDDALDDPSDLLDQIVTIAGQHIR